MVDKTLLGAPWPVDAHIWKEGHGLDDVHQYAWTGLLLPQWGGKQWYWAGFAFVGPYQIALGCCGVRYTGVEPSHCCGVTM